MQATVLRELPRKAQLGDQEARFSSLSSFGMAVPDSGPHFCQSGFPKLSRATDDAEQVRTVGLHSA